MAEQRNRWSWDVTGFEPWKSSSPSTSVPAEHDDRKPNPPLGRRYSISSSSIIPQPRNTTAYKLQRLKDKVKVMRCFHLQYELYCSFFFIFFLIQQVFSVLFSVCCIVVALFVKSLCVSLKEANGELLLFGR